MIVLIKSLLIQNQSGGSITGNLTLFIGDSTSQISHVSPPVAANSSWFTEFWIVANPADKFAVSATGGPTSVWLSGAVLFGSPAIPPITALLDAEVGTLPAPGVSPLLDVT
jgi:hypothetical protein